MTGAVGYGMAALLSLSVMGTATAQAPPEIIALTSSAHDFRPVFESRPINSDLLARMKAATWHPGCPVPAGDLRELHISFWNFGGQPATGILIAQKDVTPELLEIFRELFQHGFLIERMQPIENFDGNDDRSMQANNTSAFNCRDVTGAPGKFSNHSWGRAVDINPLINPYLKGDQVLPPAGRQYLDRTRAYPGAILAGGFIVKLFESRGWTWGGSWTDRKDYQHFEKPNP